MVKKNQIIHLSVGFFDDYRSIIHLKALKSFDMQAVFNEFIDGSHQRKISFETEFINYLLNGWAVKIKEIDEYNLDSLDYTYAQGKLKWRVYDYNQDRIYIQFENNERTSISLKLRRAEDVYEQYKEWNPAPCPFVKWG